MNLKEKLEKSGIEISQAQLDKFTELTRIMLEYNLHTNITGITEIEDIEDKHYIDSLSSMSFIPKNAQVCDVGTGGGFPAIPLAIMRPDLHITAIDSIGKKIVFVKYACDTLQLNINCIKVRAEDYMRDKTDAFDILTFRAFSDLSKITAYAPFLCKSGLIIAYKGQEEKALTELKSVNSEEFSYNLYHYSLPKGDKRTLVILKKNRI